MNHVVIIGCGVVGAAIAYELSLCPGLKITVLDKQPPAQGATAAALGVLMGVISHKIKGKAWQMRLSSIQRYDTLIPELEAHTGHHIPFNQQGIVMLCFAGEDLTHWEKLVEIRSTQGCKLEIWDTAQLKSKCPQLNTENVRAAVYSPQDRQLDPVALTLAMVDAAKRNGVSFNFGTAVAASDLITSTTKVTGLNQLPLLQDIDWLVVSGGLGSSPIVTGMQKGMRSLDIKPVLGQAIHLKLSPLGEPNFQPVITGDDVHIVPVGGGDYWVGATVEFPTQGDEIVPVATCLQAVIDKAIAFCPALAAATVVKTWSGLRPRPEGRSAPVIDKLQGFDNVLLATGHYRNGVLLAPATAAAIRHMILN